MSKTEQTPSIGDYDMSFLDNIMSYSANSINRLSMVGFKALWADRFFGNPEEDKKQVLDDWEFNVALGRKVPVYLTDAEGNPRWIFPPIIAELSSTFTANPRSLDFLAREVKLIRDRFVRKGKEAEEMVLGSLAPIVSENTKNVLAVHMFMIRRECGYLSAEEERIVSALLKQSPEQTSGGQERDNGNGNNTDYFEGNHEF